MIPVYGFLEGDCLGLLVLARAEDTAQELCAKLQAAAAPRVAAFADPILVYKGQPVPAATTAAEINLQPLERIDVVGRR